MDLLASLPLSPRESIASSAALPASLPAPSTLSPALLRLDLALLSLPPNKREMPPRMLEKKFRMLRMMYLKKSTMFSKMFFDFFSTSLAALLPSLARTTICLFFALRTLTRPTGSPENLAPANDDSELLFKVFLKLDLLVEGDLLLSGSIKVHCG